ncbi:hypothetical protein L596_006617 [Steinernema carpocapsae]|uniref:Transposase Tc5 C-terminal domain-containing protein n=1 Tax=Steinernema carpocapsae TaxID=34508 RepID=A0A4U8V2L8_STECR|nr:hypothetical protein L596_006617 [Steinernema carpocapsae]
MLNLLIWQFVSPLYQEMIKLAWQKAGYLEKHPAEFVTKEEFCFRFENSDANCACDELAVFRCSYCVHHCCTRSVTLVNKC